MRPQLLTQFLTLAGSLALAIAQGVVLLVILLIMHWLHGEPRSTGASLRLRGGTNEQGGLGGVLIRGGTPRFRYGPALTAPA